MALPSRTADALRIRFRQHALALLDPAHLDLFQVRALNLVYASPKVQAQSDVILFSGHESDWKEWSILLPHGTVLYLCIIIRQSRSLSCLFLSKRPPQTLHYAKYDTQWSRR
jgi:hypothetical protein